MPITGDCCNTVNTRKTMSILLDEVHMHAFGVQGWESNLSTTVTCCNSYSVVPNMGRDSTSLKDDIINVSMSCEKPITDYVTGEGIDNVV